MSEQQTLHSNTDPQTDAYLREQVAANDTFETAYIEAEEDRKEQEDVVRQKWEAYMGEKILMKGYGKEISGRLEKQREIYEKVRQDKQAEISALKNALQDPFIKKFPRQTNKIEFDDALKLGFKNSWQEHQLFWGGLARIFISTFEFDRVKLGKLWAQIQRLQHCRKKEVRAMNMEIRELQKKLKQKITENRKRRELQNKDKKAEAEKKSSDTVEYNKLMVQLHNNKNTGYNPEPKAA